jgi:molecular chaperone GrpE
MGFMTEEQMTGPESDAASSELEEAALDSAAPGKPADVSATVAEAGTQASRIAELEGKLAELELKLARESEQTTDYMNRYQRIQADFANFKRRAEQEQGHRDQMITAQVISMFLPALDSFERAFSALPASLVSYTWIDGISLIQMEMRRALQIHGVEPIEARPGQAFDPVRHESIGEVESNEFPEGHIAAVLQSGYEIQGHVLRPILVQLARRAAVSPAEQDSGPVEADAGGPVSAEGA